MNFIAEAVRAAATADPDRIAFTSATDAWTWGDVGALCTSLNAALTALAVGRAGAVGCLMRTRPPHAATMLAVLAGDRCLATFNAGVSDSKLNADLVKLRPAVIIADDEDWARPEIFAAALATGAAGLRLTGDRASPIRGVSGLESIGAGLHLDPQPGTAVLMLTSGTTGAPKRAAIGYGQLEVNFKNVMPVGGTERRMSDDFALNFMPLFHLGGLFHVVGGALLGRPSRLLERFSVDEWRSAISNLKIKQAGGAPSTLKMILDANIPKEELASLKTMSAGSSPVDPALVDLFYERYGVPVLVAYSATEFAGAGAGWSIRLFEKYWSTKRGAVGRLHPGVAGRTVDAETGEVLPVGTPGVLELRSAGIGDGTTWARTSDLARVDGDNFLWILGRADSAIVRGGFKIFPEPVAKAIEAYPGVEEACVVGITDARLGQVPVAAFTTVDGALAPDADALATHLRDCLSPYEIPVAFKHLRQLPRTPSLKVALGAVRELFGHGEDGASTSEAHS